MGREHMHHSVEKLGVLFLRCLLLVKDQDSSAFPDKKLMQKC